MSSKGSTNWILELTDKVTAPLKNIMGQAGATGKSVDVVQGNIQRLEKQASSLQSKLTKFTVGVAAFSALSYGSMQFETGMARANTMALKTQDEINAVSNSVRDLADTIPLARTQLTDGLYNVISAGVPENNWIQFLEDSAKTAIAGNAELGTVVNSTSSIIKAYGLEWDQANAIQDKLMKTVQLGQIPSLDALSQAISKPGPIAAQLGVTIDELMSSMTALAGPNGEVNQTGTQMKAVMSSLLKPTSEAAKMADNLGVAFDAAAIKGAGGLVPFLENLSQKTESYAAQTGQSAETIYGQLFSSTEALSAVMTLTSSAQQTFAENTAKIANSAGVVGEAFEIMNGTSQNAMILMKNSFQNTMDELVKVIAPFVVMGTKGIGAVLQVVRNFAQQNPMLFKIVTTIAFGVTVMYGMALASTLVYTKLKILTLQMWAYTKPLLMSIAKGALWIAQMGVGAVSALGTYIIALLSSTAAQWGLNVAMTANPVGVIIVGILALVAAFAALFVGIKMIIKKWEEWGKYAQMAITMILPPLGLVISFIKSIIDNWDNVKAAFMDGGILGGIKAIGKVIFDAILMPIQTMLELLSEVPGVGNLAEKGAKAIQELRGSLFDETNTARILRDNPAKRDSKKEAGLMPGLDFDVDDFMSGNSNVPTPEGGNTITGTGGTGSGKSITMNLDIVNNFIVDSQTNIENLAEQIIGKINDKLRDATVALG